MSQSLLSITIRLPGVPGCATICGHRFRLSRPSTDALPDRSAVHRTINWNEDHGGREETRRTIAPNGEAQRAHLKLARATTVSPRLRTTTQLAFHSHQQHTLPALQVTHPSPRPRATVNLIPQPTGTTTHTHHDPLHNHQSIPPPARHTRSTTNTQSAKPTTPLKPIRTGRVGPSRPNTLSNNR
jgi:hypothetical protein